MATSDRELLAIVDAEFQSAMGAPDGEISVERARSWEYYNSEPLGNEVEGKSQVVTSDVAEVVDGIMPSLMRMFSTRDNLVSFDAVGPEDEALAQQETDYTSHVFFKGNPDSFLTLHTWCFDTLTQKNGYVKCYEDESERVTEETYNGLVTDSPELLKLLSDDELEPVEQRVYMGETVDAAGEVIQAELQDIRFKRTCKKVKIRVEPVPPEEMRISSDSRSPYVTPDMNCRMIGQESKKTRQVLIDMGFDEQTVLDLPVAGNTPNSEEETARRSKEDDFTEGSGAEDKLSQEVWVRECFIKIDGEVRQVFTSNNKLLANDPADRHTYHCLTSKPLPHKHFGSCPAEMVMDIQQISTTLFRQALDNIYQTNNPRNIVYEQAIGEDTWDGLLSTELGGNIVVDRPPGEAIAPYTVPFTAAATFPMLEMMEKTKRDRTGVHSSAEGIDPDSLKNIQGQVMREAVTMSKDKIELIARIFAETGFRSLFQHIHELIRKNPDPAGMVKLRGRWIPVDPSSWRDRTDLTINIGLGIGSKESNLMQLATIKDAQRAAIEAGYGNLVVKPRNVYNTLREIANNAEQDAELHFTDPGDAMFPPTSQEAMQLQQQAALLQQQAAQLEQERQRFNKDVAADERERIKIAQNQSQHEDKMLLQIEQLQNEIAEIRLKYDEVIEANQPDFTFQNGQLMARQ